MTGRVQGVGFRWWTRKLARDLGLVGRVRNRVDGSVEIRAAGDEAALKRLEVALRRGPATARVDSVEVVGVADGEPTDEPDGGPGGRSEDRSPRGWSDFEIERE